jgi:beta-lactam-binding protein with PASTA domain/predicted Ser/Thr protein kinase
MSGSVLGDRYRIEARIGSGGMAEVYRGFDPVLNRTVAIKILLPQFARDASFVERFRREAQAAARLNHPNIVGVFDTGADGDTQYIVMEFIEGRTLADFMAAGRRPTPVQAAEIARKICGALAAAHGQGVIHRDIKPGNVMVTRDGTVKVMDFGIARITSGIETAPQTSAVLGTATYLSPEQAQGAPLDARTDIYSLGAVLYELLTGRPPFTGESPVAIAYKQVNESPVPPSQRNPDVPARLDAVVMRALAKNPANRYQSASEFSEDLGRVVKGQDVEATPLLPGLGEATQVISRPQATGILPPQEEARGSTRKVWLGILIGVLIVAVLGGGGFLLVNSLTKKSGQLTVTLPDVTKKPYDTAKSELEALGLTVQDPPLFKVTNSVKAGTVIEQNPASGTQLAKGGTVVLTVAKAPSTVSVPDLTGKTLSQAQAALDPFKLHIGSQTQAPSDTVPAGQIVGQSPPPNTQVKKGSFVDVVISSGPAQVTVPTDIVCRSLGSVTTELTKLGLKVVNGGIGPANPSCPQADRVVSSSPAPGTTVNAGSTVTIYTGAPPSPSPSPSTSPSP